MLSKPVCALALLCAFASSPLASEVSWEQRVNMPAGENLPPGITLDIVGLSAGQSAVDAKSALSAHLSNLGSDASVNEVISTLTYGAGTAAIRIDYVAGYKVSHQFGPGGNTNESITVHLSSPASGSQVIGVTRLLTYSEQSDQPRVGELVKAMAQKVGADPFALPAHTTHRWQFDGGTQVQEADYYDCNNDAYFTYEAGQIDGVNRYENCDVYLDVKVSGGISPDHAQTIEFTLSDNERTKTNLSADFDFFDSYIDQYQTQTGGQTPSL